MTDNKNLNLWNKVSRVPGEHLKPFNNGKFAGTAIKPLWFTKTMTEMFGPCGTGWFIDKPEYQLVDAGESKMVYCTLGVWVKDGQRVYGVGGDFAVRNGKGDDEAFKKAYTDALTNALVKFGVAADVHMGLWDGNKYVGEKPEAEEKPVMPSANGTPGASKAASRADYDRIAKAFQNATGVQALTKIYEDNVKVIDAMPPDWVDLLRIEYSDRAKELKGNLAA